MFRHVHAQTNLQLYRQMIDAGASTEELAQLRCAYDLARRLFADAFRPSHKPFLAHLVGVSSALAGWRQPTDVVIAGMLHSLYLFGDFGDGDKGATPRRRRLVVSHVGQGAEELVYCYTTESTKPDKFGAAADEVLRIKLADVFDECVDAGPLFAGGKPLEFGLPFDVGGRQEVLSLSHKLFGFEAATAFADLFAEFDGGAPPECLRTSDRSYHRVTVGQLEEAPLWRVRMRRATNKFLRRKAA